MRTSLKLTPPVKRRITNDWRSVFLGLGIYKPRRLLRRVGPLVIGVVLERDSSNDAYCPLFHVHFLGIASPSLSLTLAQGIVSARMLAHGITAPSSSQSQWIPAAKHELQWREAAQLLAAQVPLPLEGDLHLRQVLQAYKAYVAVSKWYGGALNLYPDMIALCVWCHRPKQATRLLETGTKAIQKLPARIVAKIEGGIEGWRNEQEKIMRHPELLQATVAQEIINHKLEKLPVSELRRD